MPLYCVRVFLIYVTFAIAGLRGDLNDYNPDELVLVHINAEGEVPCRIPRINNIHMDILKIAHQLASETLTELKLEDLFSGRYWWFETDLSEWRLTLVDQKPHNDAFEVALSARDIQISNSLIRKTHSNPIQPNVSRIGELSFLVELKYNSRRGKVWVNKAWKYSVKHMHSTRLSPHSQEVIVNAIKTGYHSTLMWSSCRLKLLEASTEPPEAIQHRLHPRLQG